jgi:hypothetical protein
VDLAVDQSRLAVLALELGQQVAAVGGGVDEEVVRGGAEGALQHRLEGLETGLVGLEGEVVAEDDEALRPAVNQVQHLRQVHQFILVHLDQAQALVAQLVEDGLDQGRLAGPPRSPEQEVVGAAPGRNWRLLRRISAFCRSKAQQVVQGQPLGVGQGLQTALAAATPRRQRKAWASQSGAAGAGGSRASRRSSSRGAPQ